MISASSIHHCLNLIGQDFYYLSRGLQYMYIWFSECNYLAQVIDVTVLDEENTVLGNMTGLAKVSRI